MRVDKIYLNNFLSHRKTTLSLQDRGLICIVGENGAGKSSLVKDALTWGLFGKARGNGDELVMRGEKLASVTIEFQAGGRTYTIKRIREREKRTELEFVELEYLPESNDLLLASKNLNGATLADTQAKINKVLGVDYDMFVNSSCIEQGKTDSFTNLSPKEAKRLLTQILRLNQYQLYYEQAKGNRQSVGAKIAGLNYSLANLPEPSLSTEDCSEVAGRGKYLARLEEDAWNILQAEKDIMNRLSSEHEQVLQTYNKSQAELTLLKERYRAAKLNLAKVQMVTEKCPVCTGAITPEKKTEIVASFESKFQQTELDLSKTTFDEAAGQLELAVCRLEEAQERIESLSSWIGQIKDQRIIVERDLGTKQGLIREREQIERTRQELTAQIAEEQASEETWAILEKAFDQHGIPTLILENVIPELEQSANEVLNFLSQGRLRVELCTQRELKTGGFGDTLQIKIKSLTKPGMSAKIDSEGEYQALSGGEAYRVDLSLRIALSRLLARRNNFRVDTLVIDEGLGSLDAEGRQRFIELMEKLKDEFSRILVITHTDAAEYFKSVLQVSKENGESTIQWLH